MPERGSPNSNNSLDVGSLLPFDEVGEVVEGSRAKLHVPPPKPQWKGHVYFLGGVLYVNSLSQKRHGSTNGRISFIT